MTLSGERLRNTHLWLRDAATTSLSNTFLTLRECNETASKNSEAVSSGKSTVSGFSSAGFGFGLSDSIVTYEYSGSGLVGACGVGSLAFGFGSFDRLGILFGFGRALALRPNLARSGDLNIKRDLVA